MTGPGPLRRALYHTHFLFAGLLGGLAFLLVSAFGLLDVAINRDRKAAGRLAHAYSAVMRVILGWRITVENRERLNLSHPVVLMVRHQTNLDVVTTGMIYPFRTVVLGKKEIRKIPLFGWFFGAAGNIFIDRQNPRKAFDSIREAADRVIRESLSVWVFPEGTRNSTRQLRPFKKGGFHLAITAQIPILPIVSGPIDSLLDADRWMVRPGRLMMRVLPEIPSAGLTADQVDVLVGRVWQAMDEGQKALLEGSAPPIG